MGGRERAELNPFLGPGPHPSAGPGRLFLVFGNNKETSVRKQRRYVVTSVARAHEDARALRAEGWTVVATLRGGNVRLVAWRGEA